MSRVQQPDFSYLLRGGIQVFGISHCPRCKLLCVYLERSGVPFTRYNLDMMENAALIRIWLRTRYSGTLPVTFLDGILIGGYNGTLKTQSYMF